MDYKRVEFDDSGCEKDLIGELKTNAYKSNMEDIKKIENEINRHFYSHYDSFHSRLAFVGEQMETTINKDIRLSEFYDSLGINLDPYSDAYYKGWKWDEANQEYIFDVL